jgi:hypothetical protein
VDLIAMLYLKSKLCTQKKNDCSRCHAWFQNKIGMCIKNLISPAKFAHIANSPFLGEKNGNAIGKTSNIAPNAASPKQKNENTASDPR